VVKPATSLLWSRGEGASLHIGQSLFQGGSPLGHLRVLDGGLGKTVIGVQAKRQQEILAAILLGEPTVNVGLSEFNCIEAGMGVPTVSRKASAAP
jgi:hypothetical protein